MVAEANGNKKMSEAERAKARKQKQKENRKQRRQQGDKRDGNEKPVKAEGEEEIEIEYVSAPVDFGSESDKPEEEEEEERPGLGGLGFGLGLGHSEPKVGGKEESDPMADFKKIFERFASAEQVTAGVQDDDEDAEGGDGDEDDVGNKDQKKAEASASDSGSDGEGGEGSKKMSKKQRKMLSRLKIAELKQLCERPDVVEVWDVTSPDPQLLVFLKGYRNTVSVPRHWSQKRKYLQGKRGIEKPPFKLPDFIEATGISNMRQAYAEKEDGKKLKAKQRDKMAPKMGKMDINYHVLHEAFFKHQTRPKLTLVGDIYYEGKEFEARVENLKPGTCSDKLQEALGMTSESTPPPWLINMQRYGPPPSYPDLKIPGLNAPIPKGASFGYHAGGWGKPPVDEGGVPLYGDVFGQRRDALDSDDEVDKVSRWGELEVVEEESSEEEEEEELEDHEVADGIASGIATGVMSGMVSGLTSGIASSLPSGIETPDTMLNLRKGQGIESEQPRPLYQVLEQKQISVGAGNIMGSSYTYVIPPEVLNAQGGVAEGGKKDKKKLGVLQGLMPSDVEVNLQPEELEGLDEAGIKALYEEKVAEARAANRHEDLSDMVRQKRKLAQKSDDKASKKTKESFKF